MKFTIARNVSIDGVALNTWSAPTLRRVLGEPESVEKIPLHGGGVRFREAWRVGVSMLRDAEEIVCLHIDAAAVQVIIADEELPDLEREFVKRFRTAQKEVGHSYTLVVESWRLNVDFQRAEKRRGAGSTRRRLSRVIVGRQKPNQALQPTRMLVTFRAYARPAPSTRVADL